MRKQQEVCNCPHIKMICVYFIRYCIISQDFLCFWCEHKEHCEIWNVFPRQKNLRLVKENFAPRNPGLSKNPPCQKPLEKFEIQLILVILYQKIHIYATYAAFGAIFFTNCKKRKCSKKKPWFCDLFSMYSVFQLTISIKQSWLYHPA